MSVVRVALASLCATLLFSPMVSSLLQPPTSPAHAAGAPRRFALLIGVNQYKNLRHLSGCVNDIHLIRNILIGKFGFSGDDISLVTDKQATRDSILGALKGLAGKVAAGDVVVIHYSGHGSRLRDNSGDEIDKWDETICPYDTRDPGVFDITDDELNVLFNIVAAKTPRLTVVLDSCHSGSATRGGTRTRRAPDDERTPPAALASGPRTPGAEKGGLIPRDEPYVLISGSAPHELSNEYEQDGRVFGALTYFLTKNIETLGTKATYNDLMESVKAEVTGAFPSQHPQIEGAARDGELLSGAAMSRQAFVLVSPAAGNTVVVDAGAVHGVTRGTQFAVYPPRTNAFEGQPASTVDVFSVDALTSKARVSAGAAAVLPLSRALWSSTRFPDFKLNVYFSGLEQSQALQRIREAVRMEPNVNSVTDQSTAHVILSERQGRVHLTSGDLEELSPALSSTDAATLQTTRTRLKQWARWHQRLAIANPNPAYDVGLTIRRPGSTAEVSEVINGERIEIDVTNNSKEPFHVAVLDFATDGSIAPLFVTQGGDRLAPGQSHTIRPRMVVPEGRATVTDIIKVFATNPNPLDASLFAQASIKNAVQDDVQKWAVVQRRVRVAQTGTAKVAGFLAHVEAGRAGDNATTIRSALPACPNAASSCWQVAPFPGDDSIVEISRLGTRGEDFEEQSLGQAWDEAYRLRAFAGATRVEPLIEVDGSEWNIEDFPYDEAGTRSGRTRPDKEPAKNDAEWSLTHVRALDAWAAVNKNKQRLPSSEGSGVMVAHPDTGYRKHPEFWDADVAKTTVLAALGFDYVDKDDEPFDPMLNAGLIPNPGHGTKSGSVIVSPRGRQLSGGDAKRYVSGIAPGARLIPLRVHTSVVHLRPGNLARAITDAAGDDRKRVKKPIDVVSISMGGLPSWALLKAVRRARDKGLILVAAAGNEVGFVVWPARFKEAIAVAATNVECGTWEGSSHGSAVDIAAPGESVWRAEVDKQGIDDIGMGQGTTFATATMAGIAALWIDYHRGDPEFERLRKDGLLQDKFREIVRRTSWTPGNRVPANVQCTARAWDPDYGAGIVDAARALEEPLTGQRGAPAEREPIPLRLLPLFSSLLPAETDEATVTRRYRALLVLPAAAALGTEAELEGEIVQHYALESSVRDAFAPIVAPAEPGAAAYTHARAALRAGDISSRLRDALPE